MSLRKEDPNVTDLRTITVQARHNVPQHPLKALHTALHIPREGQGKPRSAVKLKRSGGNLHLTTLLDRREGRVEPLCDLLPHPDPRKPPTDSALDYHHCFPAGLFRLNKEVLLIQDQLLFTQQSKRKVSSPASPPWRPWFSPETHFCPLLRLHCLLPSQKLLFCLVSSCTFRQPDIVPFLSCTNVRRGHILRSYDAGLSIPLCISSPLKIWSVLSGLSGHGWSEAILVAGIREGLEKLLEVGAPTIQLFNSASAAAAEDDLSHWLSYQ